MGGVRTRGMGEEGKIVGTDERLGPKGFFWHFLR